jgi:hypothetical protein
MDDEFGQIVLLLMLFIRLGFLLAGLFAFDFPDGGFRSLF